MAVLSLALADVVHAQTPGEVLGEQEIGVGSGGFGGDLGPGDLFGSAVAKLGDLDGNGVVDIAVGAPGDDDGGPQRGAVWVLFLQADGTVLSETKLSASAGFPGELSNQDGLGEALAALGDLDGDGVTELAVGAPKDDDGGSNLGAVWVLFLTADGGIKAHTKISAESGGFSGRLSNQDEFGRALATLGDLGGDGLVELAVGALNDDDGSPQQGAVWILSLETDGTVASHLKLSEGESGFTGPLDTGDEFGRSVAALGDLDGNGVTELAVGASMDDAGGPDRGAVWVLYLASSGQVIGQARISATDGGFTGLLDDGDEFGRSLACPGDLDGDDLPDLAVGAVGDDDGGFLRGAVWILQLSADGSVTSHLKLAQDAGGFGGSLADFDGFGTAAAALGDLDGDGSQDLVVGAAAKSGGAAGEAWVLFLFGPPQEEIYIPPTSSFVGRAGRPTLVKPDGSLDFIDEPVFIVPNAGGDTVTVRTATVGSGGDVLIIPGLELHAGESPSASDSGNFSLGGAGLGFLGVGAGLADVVVANFGSDDFSLFPALPGGGFGLETRFSLLPLNGAPVAIRAADFDGDGRLDVALAGDNGVSVLLGNGALGFPASTFTAVPLLTDLAVGLVDDDAILDIVTTSGRAVTPSEPTEEGFATVLLGVGDGTFTTASTFAAGQALASVLLGPIDGDAPLDALITIHGFDDGPGGIPRGRIELFAGDGAGAFSPASTFAGFETANAEGIVPTYGALGDLDADGDLDAVYTRTDDIARPADEFAEEQPPVVLTILRGDGTGGFEVAELGTAYAGKGVDPLLADFVPDDGEGYLDGALVWYGDTAAGLEQTTGDQQLLSYIAALEGDGTAAFFDTAPNQYATGKQPGNGAIAGSGLRGSGQPDIVVPNMLKNSLTILQGDGDGGVLATVNVPDVDEIGPLPVQWVGGPRDVVVGDLDGDGNLDALVYNAWEDTSELPDPQVYASLSVYGTVEFEKVQYVALPRGGELALADVDGNGRDDAIVTQRLGAGGADEIRIYSTDIQGRLVEPPQVVAVPAGLTLSGGLLVSDLGGSAAPEVLTTAVELDRGEAGAGPGRLLVFGDLDGAVSTAVSDLDSSFTEVRSLALADVDGDELLDVLVGVADNRLILAAGQAGGGFAPQATSPGAAAVGGGAIAAADVDDDGDVDIVSATSTQSGAVDQSFVRTLLGAGDGTFVVQTVPGLSSTGLQGPLRPLLGDLEGDGFVDLVVVHGSSDSVSILLNELGRFDLFGAGKPGSAGITPLLTGSGSTSIGGPLELLLSDTLGGTLGLLWIGSGPVETGFLHVEVVVLEVPLLIGGAAGVPGAGSALLPVVIPPDGGLVGVEIVLQGLVLDPGAGGPGPGDIAASNGLSFVIEP